MVNVSSCAGCGRHHFSVIERCTHCGEEVTGEILSGRGHIYSLTKVHLRSGKLETPYLLALIELDGAGRVLGRLVGPEAEEAKIGDSISFQALFGSVPLFRPGGESRESNG